MSSANQSPLMNRPGRWPQAFACALLLAAGGAARAAAIIDNSGASAPIMSPDGLVKVALKPITPISSATFDTALSFGIGTVANGASAAGTYTIASYQPVIKYNAAGNPTDGGAAINAQYVNPSVPAANQQLQFIQVASTTGFGNAYATPHIDPLTPDDALPFYWTNAEIGAYRNASGSALSFNDGPHAGFGALANGPVSFTADLRLAQTDGATAATVRDGFTWGYDMTLATDGKTSASFNNPSPGCPPATCAGVGGAAFSWGVGVNSPPSSLQFSGANFTPTIGTPFQIGTLTYFNGTIAGGTEVDSVDLDLANSFGFGATLGAPIPLAATLQLINTSNGGIDPAADADFVLFQSGGFSGSFHVFEGATASIPLMAELTAGATLIAEKQLTDAGGLSSPFTLQISGFGDVSGGGFVTTDVPEPGTIWLLALPLFGLIRRRGQ